MPVEPEEGQAHEDLGRLHGPLGVGEHAVGPLQRRLRAGGAPGPVVAVGHDLELVHRLAEPAPVGVPLIVPLAGFRGLGHHRDGEEASLGVQRVGELLDEPGERVAVGRPELLPVEVDAVVSHVADEGEEVVHEAAAALRRSQYGRRQLAVEGARRVRGVGHRGEEVEVVPSRRGHEARVLVLCGDAAVRLRVIPVEVDLVDGSGCCGGLERGGVTERPRRDRVAPPAERVAQVAERRVPGPVQV